MAAQGLSVGSMKLLPEVAWKLYIYPHANKENWIEDSQEISDTIGLSKRELFSLVIICHYLNAESQGWWVGYDANDGEPNDGFVTNGQQKIRFEHKVIPQMTKSDPLEGILSTYVKYAKKGASYGKNRILIIHPNQETRGLIKISELGKSIPDDCPFDKVLLLSLVSNGNNDTWAMHITQHFPKVNHSRAGIGQVDFNVLTGLASVSHKVLKICS